MAEAFEPWGACPPAWLPDALAAPQGITTLRWASAGYATGPGDDLPNTVWAPRLLGDVIVTQTALDALGIGGRVALGIAEIALANGDGGLADLIRYGTADGRAVRVLAVPVTNDRASDLGGGARALVFAGMVRSMLPEGDDRASLSLTDIAERLGVPLQPLKYLGAGHTEGGDELKGSPKPITLGRCYNLPPVSLGNLDLGAGIGSLPTYQTHWRAIAGHDAVRIRGVEQVAVAGAPGVGQYRDFPALGMFQLGSTPDGAVTADLRGDAVGGYANTTASVLRRLLQSLGPAILDEEIDRTAFDFAEPDLPGEVGFYQGNSEATAAEAVQTMVAGCGAVLAGGRGGRIRLFDPLAQDADQFTLPEPWVLDCRPVALPAKLRPLPRAVAVSWRPNWQPLSDIAGVVTGAERERLGKLATGPARSESALVTSRVAQQRDMTLPGLYWSEADALARAAKWRAWLEAGPRAFEVTTDRYLGQIECGHIGRITYPAFGLQTGARGVVLAWQEALAARRLTLTLVTLPES
ncbi:MAG TPA: hypothetical protein VD970_12860 [Acetobacteraceae bacterium]|nr:hypothetical protein [Acetobacteraceae bacterium]